jgi:hypothetical protein
MQIREGARTAGARHHVLVHRVQVVRHAGRIVLSAGARTPVLGYYELADRISIYPEVIEMEAIAG